MANNKVPSRYDWDFTIGTRWKTNILKDKGALIDMYLSYMLVRTQRMFKYTNLPNELPAREIELITQTCRFSIWKKVKDELYVFFGGLGGIPNEYYQSTKAIVVNPYLKYNENLEIDKDCVVMWNDSMHVGLMPLNEKYASLLAETDISLRYACVNTRILALLIADDDNTKDSAEHVLQDIDDGIKLGVIGTSGSNGLFDGIKTNDYANKSNSNIKDLIELHQYQLASWYNELGVRSNWNAKREAINEEEASMNEDALLPLVDDMLNQRKIAVKKINEMFGYNIEVDLSSSWKKMREEIKEQQKQVDNDNPIEGEENETSQETDRND